MRKSVCVFCGSRAGASRAYHELARMTGHAIGARGWRLVYGGGDVGLMGVLATAALEAGGQVLGIIPRRLLDREVAKKGVTDLIVTPTMFERKERMISAADAFLVLPGGFGTLDELLEVVTLRQLGYHDKPVLLLDVEGFWQRCIAFFEHVIEAGFAEPGARRLWTLVPDLASALALLDQVQATVASDSPLSPNPRAASGARGSSRPWRAREDSNL